MEKLFLSLNYSPCLQGIVQNFTVPNDKGRIKYPQNFPFIIREFKVLTQTLLSIGGKHKKLLADLLKVQAMLKNRRIEKMCSLRPLFVQKACFEPRHKNDCVVIQPTDHSGLFTHCQVKIFSGEIKTKLARRSHTRLQMIFSTNKRLIFAEGRRFYYLVVSDLRGLINSLHYLDSPPCSEDRQSAADQCLKVKNDIAPSIPSVLTVNDARLSKQDSWHNCSKDDAQQNPSYSASIFRHNNTTPHNIKPHNVPLIPNLMQEGRRK